MFIVFFQMYYHCESESIKCSYKLKLKSKRKRDKRKRSIFVCDVDEDPVFDCVNRNVASNSHFPCF